MIVAGARWEINPDEFWRTSGYSVPNQRMLITSWRIGCRPARLMPWTRPTNRKQRESCTVSTMPSTKLTYRYNGRDMRLTDVYGALIPQIANM